MIKSTFRRGTASALSLVSLTEVPPHGPRTNHSSFTRWITFLFSDIDRPDNQAQEFLALRTTEFFPNGDLCLTKPSQPPTSPNRLSIRWRDLHLSGYGPHGVWGVVILIVVVIGVLVFAQNAVLTLIDGLKG